MHARRRSDGVRLHKRAAPLLSQTHESNRAEIKSEVKYNYRNIIRRGLPVNNFRALKCEMHTLRSNYQTVWVCVGCTLHRLARNVSPPFWSVRELKANLKGRSSARDYVIQFNRANRLAARCLNEKEMIMDRSEEEEAVERYKKLLSELIH